MSTIISKANTLYTENLLQRAVVDAEFRLELLSRPEEFGLTKEDVQKLPKSVDNQDLTFVELIAEGDFYVKGKCGSTCVSGLTVYCDGNTHPTCRRTCVSGWTLRCDGATV
jgi:hypothetical protein